jgi:hypothetical protein
MRIVAVSNQKAGAAFVNLSPAAANQILYLSMIDPNAKTSNAALNKGKYNNDKISIK